MSRILDFIKNWALIFSIVIGAVGYRWFPKAGFITPYLLFFMLLFTFCRISPREIRFKRMHLWFLLIQLAGGLAIYAALRAVWTGCGRMLHDVSVGADSRRFGCRDDEVGRQRRDEYVLCIVVQYDGGYRRAAPVSGHPSDAGT